MAKEVEANLNYNVDDFLLENVEKADKTEEIHFKRFKSPFVIKQLLASEANDLKARAIVRKRDSRTNVYRDELDADKYAELVVVASVVVPNLNDAKLQENYGIIGRPEKLLARMLTAGEYNELVQRITDLSSLAGEDSDELVAEAKN